MHGTCVSMHSACMHMGDCTARLHSIASIGPHFSTGLPVVTRNSWPQHTQSSLHPSPVAGAECRRHFHATHTCTHVSNRACCVRTCIDEYRPTLMPNGAHSHEPSMLICTLT
eukprot:351469-Chlamydomonas_euryale.AAC.2